MIAADEVDSLLGKRRDNEHEATTSMKTEFMQLWDGFETEFHANVMVLAATNRPWDLDEAVLRRWSFSPGYICMQMLPSCCSAHTASTIAALGASTLQDKRCYMKMTLIILSEDYNGIISKGDNTL